MKKPSVKLSLDSPVLEIDARIATRRSGSRTKGAEAHEVLERAFDIQNVGDLLHHYPRRYIDRSRVETIRAVSASLRQHRATNIVLDPVMVAKGGSALLDPDAVACLREELIPLADVLTPNLPEAGVLLGR